MNNNPSIACTKKWGRPPPDSPIIGKQTQCYLTVRPTTTILIGTESGGEPSFPSHFGG